MKTHSYEFKFKTELLQQLQKKRNDVLYFISTFPSPKKVTLNAPHFLMSFTSMTHKLLEFTNLLVIISKVVPHKPKCDS